MSSSGLTRALLDVAFESTGITPTARAETLSVADFTRLAEELDRLGAFAPDAKDVR